MIVEQCDGIHGFGVSVKLEDVANMCITISLGCGAYALHRLTLTSRSTIVPAALLSAIQMCYSVSDCRLLEGVESLCGPFARSSMKATERYISARTCSARSRNACLRTSFG